MNEPATDGPDPVGPGPAPMTPGVPMVPGIEEKT